MQENRALYSGYAAVLDTHTFSFGFFCVWKFLFVCAFLSAQYPMYPRDYVYVRRYEVDVENNMMVLVSRWESMLSDGIPHRLVLSWQLHWGVLFLYVRAVKHPGVPETQEFVRVHSYRSRMVIRPHKSFDEVRGLLTRRSLSAPLSVSHCSCLWLHYICLLMCLYFFIYSPICLTMRMSVYSYI